MNKKHSSCPFQDEWLSDDRFRAWVGKTGNKKETCCAVWKGILIFLQCEVVLCTPMLLVRSTKNLWQHVHSKCASIDLFFKNLCSSGATKVQHKTGTVKEMLTKNDVSNAEIMCLKVVDGHFSYNSCSDLANLFQCMFADSEIPHQFSLGKNKMRVHGTVWNCSLLQIWIIEADQFIAILFFIIWQKLKFHATEMLDGC